MTTSHTTLRVIDFKRGPANAKDMGGTFDRDTKTWTVPTAKIEARVGYTTKGHNPDLLTPENIAWDLKVWGLAIVTPTLDDAIDADTPQWIKDWNHG